MKTKYIDMADVDLSKVAHDMGGLADLSDVEDYLDSLPPADVKQEIRGALVEKTGRYGEQYFVCSECGAELVYEDSDTVPEWYDFCPKCGAKMGKEVPAADVAPVVHAHWEIAIGYDPRKPFCCSECHKMNFQTDEFCPHCGAVMDEEVEEDVRR